MDYYNTAPAQPVPNNGWYGNQPQITPMNNRFNGFNQMPTEQKGITSIATVSGRESADTYPVAAGQTALLICFSSPDSGVFWLKTTDIYGRNMPMLEFNFNQKQSTENQTEQ